MQKQLEIFRSMQAEYKLGKYPCIEKYSMTRSSTQHNIRRPEEDRNIWASEPVEYLTMSNEPCERLDIQLWWELTPVLTLRRWSSRGSGENEKHCVTTNRLRTEDTLRHNLQWCRAVGAVWEAHFFGLLARPIESWFISFHWFLGGKCYDAARFSQYIYVRVFLRIEHFHPLKTNTKCSLKW